MIHKLDNIEVEKLLGLSTHYTESFYGDNQTKSIIRRLFTILLFAIMCSFSFLLGRLSVPYAAPRLVNNSEFGSYSPAQDLIEFGKKSFDEGYGENRTNGTRIYYAGTPNKQIDAAWDALERGKYVRITDKEAQLLETPTAALHANGGYMVSLDAYHQLHCLNFLRMALEQQYYEFKQPPEALKHHIAHCVNDLRQSIQCSADITPMTFTQTSFEGKIAYDPHFSVSRTCRNWDKLHQWTLNRSVMDDPDIDLIII